MQLRNSHQECVLVYGKAVLVVAINKTQRWPMSVCLCVPNGMTRAIILSGDGAQDNK